MRRSLCVLAAVVASLVLVPAAAAGPVASDDAGYAALGERVFPDPQGAACAGPCSPHRQGTSGATSFIGFGEFERGIRYLNSKPEWRRYLEVWPLDDGRFPGNDLGRLEFSPSAGFRSAGLPTTGVGRRKSDLYLLRVTDERVPDRGKERIAISLSIHGIERAGVEGGTRTMEDLVTAATAGRLRRPILGTPGLGTPVPTFEQVLKEAIVYFVYPNPDGWLRGSIGDLGTNFQRYNGNGVDPNRDFPDVGYSFRPYSAGSEPEVRALTSVLTQIKERHGDFAAGDDLHGMPFADAFSYTLLPHGRHDWAKNHRLLQAARAINRVSEDVLGWSPLIQPSSAPEPECVPTTLGDACGRIYAQTYGTVYDTIDYTTTGSFGDWLDSNAGLASDGIDNEMAFSHLDRNTAFDPMGEQLHVDGNKGLILAHVTEVLRGGAAPRFAPRGVKGYVPLPRVRRRSRPAPTAPPGTSPQGPIDETVVPESPTRAVFPFTVREDARTWNGGMRVEVTQTNVGGNAPTSLLHTLRLECQGCDRHPGVEGDDEWVEVTTDYNQSGVYTQAGLVATVNRPQSSVRGKPVRWRAVVDQPSGPVRVQVTFTREPASVDGETGGGEPARQAGYDVAATDFWRALNRHAPRDGRFRTVDADALARRRDARLPSGLDSLVLTDEALPGWIDPATRATRQRDTSFSSAGGTAPCAYQEGTPRLPSCSQSFPLTVQRGQSRATVRIEFTAGQDLALEVVRETPEGEESFGFSDGGEPVEELEIPRPPAGRYTIYVHNFAAADASFRGTVRFGPVSSTGARSRYTRAQYDRYTSRLRRFVQAGGNLVLTDGALRALPALVPAIRAGSVEQRTVYVGQLAFSRQAGTTQDPRSPGNTLGDPLARDVVQPGARFGSGLRRQTYEPTPIGFAIQNSETGADESHARSWVVDRAAWERAGGRTVGIGVDSGTRGAGPVETTTALGELRLGRGRIRIVSALLPQPTQEFDHPGGLEPHGVTYTGYFLARNLTDWCRPGGCRRSGTGTPGGTRRDRLAPITRIERRQRRATRRRIALRGTSRDRAPRGLRPRLVRVEISVARRLRGGGCRHLDRRGTAGRGRSCSRVGWMRVRGTSRWRFSLRARRKLPRGTYVVRVRGIDAAGNRERRRPKRNTTTFRIR